MSRSGGTSLTGAKVQVVIGSDSSQARGDMRSFGQTIQDWGRRAAVAGSLLTITLTGPIAMMARTMIGATMEYEQSMNILQATTRASAEEMEAMAENAKALGADLNLPGVEASNAADAMLQLAKAGMDTNEVIGASRGVLELAIAAQMDYATAAEITATTLRTFGLEAEESSRIADLLAAGAIRSATEVSDLSQAMVMAAGTFADVNIPVEDLVTSLAILADRGLKGSRAGTGLNRAILDLVSPTDRAATAMKELGIEVFDAEGTFRSFPDIIADFENATRGMTDAQRTSALTAIFQDRSFRAMTRMIDAGADEFAEYADAVTQGGEAGELAAAQMKGLAGAMELLRSQWGSVMLELGEPFMEPLANAIRSIAEFLPRILDIPTPFLKAAGAIAAVLALLGPMLLLFSVGALAMGLLAGAAGKVALVLGTLAVTLALSERLTNSVVGAIRTFFDALRGIWVPQNELEGMNSGLDRADKNMETLGRTIGPVTDAIGRFGVYLRTFVIDSVRLVRDSIISFRQALAGDWVDSDEILALHRIWGGLGLIVREVAIMIGDFTESFREMTGADSILNNLWQTFKGFATDAHAVWVVLTALLGVFIAVKFAGLALIAPIVALGVYLFGTQQQIEHLNQVKTQLSSRVGILAGNIRGLAQSWANAAGVGAAFATISSGIGIAIMAILSPVGRLGTSVLWLGESLGRLWSAFRTGSVASTALYQWFARIGISTSLLAPALNFLYQSALLVIMPFRSLSGAFGMASTAMTNMLGIVSRSSVVLGLAAKGVFTLYGAMLGLQNVISIVAARFTVWGARMGTSSALIARLATSLIALGGSLFTIGNVIGNFARVHLSSLMITLVRLSGVWSTFVLAITSRVGLITGALANIGARFMALGPAITRVVTIGGRLTPWLSSISNLFGQATALVMRFGMFLPTLASYLGPVTKLLFTFGRPILMLLGPVGILIGLISAIVGLFMTDWRSIGDHFMPVVDTITDGLSTLRDMFGEVFGGLKDAFDEGGLEGLISELPAALSEIGSALGGVGIDILKSIFQEVDYTSIGNILLDGLVDGIEATLDTLQRVVDFLTDWFAGVDWTSIGETIAGALNSAITTAWDAVTTVHERIFDSVSEGVSGIDFSSLASEIASSAGDLFSGMWDELTAPDAEGLLVDAAQAIQGPMESIGSLVSDTIIPALSDLWDIVSARLMPTWDILKQSFSDVVQVLRDNLGPSFEQLSTGFSAVLPVIGTVAAIIAGILLVALNTLVRVLAVMLPHALSAAFGIFNALVGIITLVANNIMTVFRGLVDFVKAVFAGEWREAFDALVGIVTGVFGNLVEAVPGILSGLWQAVKGIIVGLVEGVIQLFVGLYESLVGSSIIPDMIESIIEWFASLPERVMEWITSLVTRVIEAITGLAASVIEKFTNLITTVVEAVSGFVEDVVSFYVDLATRVYEEVSSLVSSVIESFTELVTTVVESVSGFVTDVVEFFISLATDVYESVSGLVSDVVEAFIELATDVVETVAGFISDILGDMAEFAVDMYEAAKETITQAIAGVVELAGDLIESFKQPINDILSWLGEQVEAFKSAAGALVQGLIDGVKGGGGALWEAGKGMGADLIDGLKFWEGSPWPAAMPFGENAVLGFVMGMGEAEQEAYDKAVGIASNVIDLFGKTMELMELAFSFRIDEPPLHVLSPIVRFMEEAITKFRQLGLSFSEEAKENLDVVTDAISKTISVFSDAFNLIKDLADAEFKVDRFKFLDSISELKFIAEHAVRSLGWTAANMEIGLSEGASRISDAIREAFGGLSEALSFIRDLSEMDFRPSDAAFKAVSFLKFLGEHAVESLGWTARQFDRSFIQDAQIISEVIRDAFGALSDVLSFVGQYSELDPERFGQKFFDAVSFLKFLGEHAVESLGWTAQQFDRNFVSRAQQISVAIKDAFSGLAEALSFVSNLLEVTRFPTYNTQKFFDAVSFLKFLAEHAVESLGWSAHQFDSKVYPMVKELSEAMRDAFGGLNEALNFVGNILDFDVNLTSGQIHAKAMAIANHLIELGTRIMVQMHRVAAHFDSEVFSRAQEVGETMSAVFGPLTEAVDFLTRGIKLIRSGHLGKVTQKFIDHLIKIGLYIMQNFYEASQRIRHDALESALAFSQSFGPLFAAVDEILDSISSMDRVGELGKWVQEVFLVNVRQIMDTIKEVAKIAKEGESDAKKFRDSMRRIMETMSDIPIDAGGVPTTFYGGASFGDGVSLESGGSTATGSGDSDQTVNIHVSLANGAVQISTTSNENLSEQIGDEIVERVIDQLLYSVSTGPTIARRTLPGAS